MGSAPVPPHERTWRHPSELAADHRAAVAAERPSTTARTLALLTGAAGIVLVGVAVLALSPRGTSAPSVAIESGSSRIEPAAITTALAIRSREPAQEVLLPLATPIQPGTMAVLPSNAVHQMIGAGRSAVAAGQVEIEVRLDDGSVVAAAVIDPGTGTGLALVKFDPTDDLTIAFAVTSSMPAGNELVTVLIVPPITVPFASIGTLDIDEGTPVVNLDGQLIGLCTDWDDERPGRFTPIDDVLVGAIAPGD